VQKKRSDRSRWAEEVLFKSYRFALIEEQEHFEILNTYWVFRFITFNGKAAPIRDQDVELLHKLLDTAFEVVVVSTYLALCVQVVVEKGPSTGFIGTLESFAAEKKVRADLVHLEHSLLIAIPLSYLSPAEV